MSAQVQELTFELADIYLELLELKQKKFERTAGNLDPKLLQKMVTNKITMQIIFDNNLLITEGLLLLHGGEALREVPLHPGPGHNLLHCHLRRRYGKRK